MSSKKTKSTKETKLNKKSPRKKSYELVAPDCWVNELAEIDINDSSWKCSVTIIEEDSTDSSVYMEHFNESTITGQKLSIKSISKLEVMHYVVKNRAENYPDKSLSPLKLLCSEIFKVVGPEFKNKIPTPLLASLIKYIILDYKILNKTIREGIEKRKKEFEEYQQSLWQTPAKSISSKGTKSSKLEKKSNKLDKVTKVKTSEKPFTKLRKRGEEWKDKIWIDDSPHDGPQLYIAISTFYDPDLPLELLNLNIPLHAITKVSLWETGFTTSCNKGSVPTELRERFKTLQDFRHKSTPHLSSTLRKRLGNKNDKTERSDDKIYSFWEKINKYKTELPTALLFKNVMFLIFTPEHSSFQYHIKEFQEEIYKQISYFLYDVHEIAKQHAQYISEIKQTNVYSAEIVDLSDMKTYQSLLDSVPHETLNIAFLLDAIIIQVSDLEIKAGEKGTVQDLSETTNKVYTPDESNYLTMTLLKQLNLKYDLFCDQFTNTVFDEEKSKSNIDSCSIKHVLKHFDQTNITTFHLQEDIAEFVRKRIAYILQVAWNDILTNFFSISHKDENIVKLCSEIIKAANESDENSFHYYMYILTVNSILNSLLIHDFTNSTLKKNSSKDILHYDRKNMCQDCKLEVYNEISSVESVLKSTMSNLSNSSSSSTYKLSDQIVQHNQFYIEYMTTDVMLQWIQAHWYNFNKFETRYCPFTNQVVIVFHNFLNSKVATFEENWIGKLTTYVPIRDFVEYILEEEKDWLSQFHTTSTEESSKVDKTVTFFIEKLLPDELLFLFPEHQFISHRSLKYETILKQKKSEKPIKVSLTEKSKSPKAKAISKQSDSTKKSKRKGKQEKKMSESKPVSADSFREETLKEDFKFIGYDLGEPMRFQFSGLKKVKVLDGCCRISLQTMEKLYGEKSQTLTVTLNDHSLYYMYKPYCESTLVNPFHMILSSGIILYFGLFIKENKGAGPFDQIPETFARNTSDQVSLTINNSALEKELLSHQEIIPVLGENEFLGSIDLTPNEWSHSKYFTSSAVNQGVPYFEIPLTYYLKISLPNGLHIEFVKEKSLFYIRQTLLSKSRLTKKVEKDKFRCFLSNGCIIKFLLNDTLEILSPSGLIYSVFEIKEELFKPEKEDLETTEVNTLKPLLSDTSVKKNKNVSIKENIDELSKTSKTKTVPKNDKKSNDSNHTEKILIEETERNTNLNNIYNFKCTTSDGKRFTVQDNKVTEVLDDLLTTHTVNISKNCIDSERTDGVWTKHLSNGSLLVQFTDGSRITSTPVEAGEVFCEWSSEELNQWFSDSKDIAAVTTDFQTHKSLSKLSDSSDKKKSVVSGEIEKLFTAKESFHTAHTILNEILPNEQKKEPTMSVLEESSTKSEEKPLISKTSTRTLLTSLIDQYIKKKPFFHDDGFIVYNMSYLMEHPNYSSVYYNANNCEVELKLPLNTSITLKNDGCYEAHFDEACLTVDNDEIYFGKMSESGDFERTTVINNSLSNNKTPVDLSTYFNRMASLPLSVDEFCQSIGIKSLLKGTIIKTDIRSGVLLYCVDSKVHETIVDYDFNIYELSTAKEKCLTPLNDFSSVVINDDLSGFRLVSDEEVESHLQLITEECGLLQETDNSWKSLLTAVPVVKNESEKWLMHYQENLTETTEIFMNPSTYGKKESWIHPFVEKEEKGHDLAEYKAVIVRLLHKIPDKENILDKLKVVVTNYNRKTSKNNYTRIFLDEFSVNFFSLDELIRDPKSLCKIIKDENIKKSMEADQFRRDMKHIFLHTLVNSAIIKARNMRKQNKLRELKSSLKRKEIPPYHFSAFGYVHSILDDIFEDATRVSEENLTKNNYEKVNFIIDELLSLVSKTKLNSASEDFDDDNVTNETASRGIKSLVSGIFRNVYILTEERNSQIYINDIMEKPLKLITSDDIEFISNMFGSGDSPLLNDEEFILQDVLDARLQLSNYFDNLRAMLEFHRGISPTQHHGSLLLL